MAFTTAKLASNLSEIKHAPSVVVAFSGGLDSTVLLHALAQIRDTFETEIRAVHIHHGLEADADHWTDHCQNQCDRLDIPLDIVRIKIHQNKGNSLEAQARDARYAALAETMNRDDILLTAHHQNDQAETLLLQLLRGAGPAGLAAMRRIIDFKPGRLMRPLLDFSRDELECYAIEQGLKWIDDNSNLNCKYDRNYLRHEIMPVLLQRWPAATKTISRSALLCGDLADLTDAHTQQDINQLQGQHAGTLSINGLTRLPKVRRLAILRQWIRRNGFAPAASRHLERIDTECVLGRVDSHALVQWEGHDVRRYRDDLFIYKTPTPIEPGLIIPWTSEQPIQLPADLGVLKLGSSDIGIPIQHWREGHIEVRFRSGGERCIPQGQTQHKTLKSIFQDWGIPHWERDRIPLIYLDNELVAIPGRLLCHPFSSAMNGPGLVPEWITNE